jgi:hypothetical protein
MYTKENQEVKAFVILRVLGGSDLFLWGYCETGQIIGDQAVRRRI